MAISVVSGPWSEDVIGRWLRDTAIPLRLATTGSSGPIVQSLWFLLDGDALWCATQAASTVATRLRRDPRVGWEVSPDAPPYRGVRGRGTVDIVEDSREVESVLRRLIDRYGQSGSDLEGWLLSRIDSEIALRIGDLTVTSWDYSRRM